MFNFYVGDAGINENVFCYSNINENEKALVLYNNVYQSTSGWVRESVGYNDSYGNVVSKSLTDALQIKVLHNHFTILRDELNNLEYIRNNMDLAHNGLYAELNGYNYQVYSSIREVYANDVNPYDRLHERLAGGGVSSIETSLHELKIEPVMQALKVIFDPDKIKLVLKGKASKEIIESYEISRLKILDFTKVLVSGTKSRLLVKNLPATDQLAAIVAKQKYTKSNQIYINSVVKKNISGKHSFYLCLQFCHFVLDAIEDDDKHVYYNSWLFDKIISENDLLTKDELALLRLFANYHEIDSLLAKQSRSDNTDIFQIPDIKNYLLINYYDGIYYLNRERWEELLDNLFVVEFFDLLSKGKQKMETTVSKWISRVKLLKTSAQKVGYDLEKLIEKISA